MYNLVAIYRKNGTVQSISIQCRNLIVASMPLLGHKEDSETAGSAVA